MRYYIISPYGRTGSRRIQMMLECQLSRCLIDSLHMYNFYGEAESDTVEFFQTNNDKNSPFYWSNYKKEVKTYAEIQEILRSCEDKTTVHSHSMVPILDLENWTVIHSTRKSKAEQIMSRFIAQYVNSFDPLDKDIKFIPFELEKEDVLNHLATILRNDKMVKDMFPNCIDIFMEDDYKQIQEKLKITFDAETIDGIDKSMVSNHRYPDLITNYLDVFKWCGEND